MKCATCDAEIHYDGKGSWIDATDGDGCDPDVHRPNQDAAFYVRSNDWEEVWKDEDKPRFCVLRNGEMRIQARKDDNLDYEILRYSDNLEHFGIRTDADLIEWENKGWAYLEWDNNPWFEVWDSNNPYDDSPVFHLLDEAVEWCVQMTEKYGADSLITE